MNLAIDIGNSSVKAGCFDVDQLTSSEVCNSIEEVLSWIDGQGFEHAIAGSVRKGADFDRLRTRMDGNLIVLDSTTPVPLQVDYKTPETLGMDRVAAAVGAASIEGEKDLLVIDFGSCITYDFVKAGKSYEGGIISPGLRLRIQSMHSFTDQLPMIDDEQLLVEPAEVPFVGKSTYESIVSGVINGMIGEVDSVIQRYINEHNVKAVLACGGDAQFFENRLKAGIFVVPNLVLIGLNKILGYNLG